MEEERKNADGHEKGHEVRRSLNGSERLQSRDGKRRRPCMGSEKECECAGESRMYMRTRHTKVHWTGRLCTVLQLRITARRY